MKIVLLIGLIFAAFASVAISAADAGANAPTSNYLMPDIPPMLTTYNGRLFSIRVGFAILYDYTLFEQNQPSITQVGQQQDQDDLRSGRLLLSGALKFKKPWIYVIGRDYNENREPDEDLFEGIDMRLMIPVWSDTKLSIGKQKEPFVYEMVGDAAFLPQQERILSPFFVSRNIGLKLSGTMADKKMTWSAGWFNNWFEKDVAFDESGNEFAARLTGLPLISSDGAQYLHLGFSARHLGATEGKLRFKGRPESNVADNYLDTGNLAANSASEIAFETLYNRAGASILFEVIPDLWVDSPENSNPHFSGYYVTASWLLTGENRPYDRINGYARNIIPRRRIGAWEPVVRYSHIDLTDESVDGGILDKWYFGVNWWASRQWKFGIGEGIANLNKVGIKGRTNSFLLRAQWIY